MTWSWHANCNNPGMDRNPPTDRMDNRPRIRDTAGQDQVLGKPARRLPRHWPWLAPRRRRPGGGDRLGGDSTCSTAAAA